MPPLYGTERFLEITKQLALREHDLDTIRRRKSRDRKPMDIPEYIITVEVAEKCRRALARLVRGKGYGLYADDEKFQTLLENIYERFGKVTEKTALLHLEDGERSGKIKRKDIGDIRNGICGVLVRIMIHTDLLHLKSSTVSRFSSDSIWNIIREIRDGDLGNVYLEQLNMVHKQSKVPGDFFRLPGDVKLLVKSIGEEMDCLWKDVWDLEKLVLLLDELFFKVGGDAVE